MNLKNFPLIKVSTETYKHYVAKNISLPGSMSLHMNPICNKKCNSEFQTSIFFSYRFGQPVNYAFTSSSKPKQAPSLKIETKQDQYPYLAPVLIQLKNKIHETTRISSERLEKRISEEVQKEIQIYRRLNKLIKDQPSQQEIKLIAKQKLLIQANIRQNSELVRFMENHEDHRAMIMIRLSILWNDSYDDMSIDELIFIVNELESSKQLRNNQLKFMVTMFLAVQVVKKSIMCPRVNLNMICSTKSITQNILYAKQCFKGQIQVRKNLQKVQNLLTFLSQNLHKQSNRYCFMKVQVQIQYLTTEIFRSFHQPDSYSDKSLCLLANPPRVIFEEPFHQEYDRFIEMAVLLLFDKRFRKQQKSSKLEDVKDIFAKLKVYEQGKLHAGYQKPQTSVLSIRNSKKKVNRMSKRVGIIDWIKCYAEKQQWK